MFSVASQEAESSIDAIRSDSQRVDPIIRLFNVESPRGCRTLFLRRITFKTPYMSDINAQLLGSQWIPGGASPFNTHKKSIPIRPTFHWPTIGSFVTGSTSSFDGNVIVQRSIALGTPVVYVSIAYRLNALGFLASQEVKDAGVGNLGLHDR